MGRVIGGVTDVVIGRKLWQERSQFWSSASADDPFGQFINPVRKHVVSRSLTGDLGWNSMLVDADPAAYVRSCSRTNRATAPSSAASRPPAACSSRESSTR